MALARAYAVGLVGLDGHVVEVEADLAQGIPGLTVIGLPDAALGEARDRVRAAIVNSGQVWPSRRITLALSPASLPKRGSGFDLALAAAVLAANGVVPADALLGRVLVGELSLDGRVRPVRGVLPSVLTAFRAGFDKVVVPLHDLREAQLLPGMDARGVGSLRDLVDLLTGEPYDDAAPPLATPSPAGQELDMVDVAGQLPGRTAIEVSAAGGRHALLLGPPGSSKTMLAERMPGVLPPLDLDAALEVSTSLPEQPARRQFPVSIIAQSGELRRRCARPGDACVGGDVAGDGREPSRQAYRRARCGEGRVVRRRERPDGPAARASPRAAKRPAPAAVAGRRRSAGRAPPRAHDHTGACLTSVIASGSSPSNQRRSSSRRRAEAGGGSPSSMLSIHSMKFGCRSRFTVSNKTPRRPAAAFASGAVPEAIASTYRLVPVGSEPAASVSAIAFGLMMSGLPAVIAAHLADVLTPREFAGAFGRCTLAFGVAQLCGPPLGGLLAESTGSFTVPFVLAAAVAALGAASSVSVMRAPGLPRGT